MKTYQIKTYNIDGSYKSTISPADILNEIKFTLNVNGGVGQLRIDMNAPAISDEYSWGEFVKVRVFDENHKDWKQIYFWYISQIIRTIESSREYISFVCLWIQGLLNNILFTNGVQTQTPSDMIKSVVTLFNEQYNCITEWNIDETVTDAQNFNWNYNSCFDVIKTVCELNGNKFLVDWEWKLNYYKQGANHFLHLHYDVESMTITDTIESIVNNYFLARNGGTVQQYYNNDSIESYGRKDAYESKTDLNSANTQNQYGNQYIEDNKLPKESMTITVNTNFPFEDIMPWDTVTVLNSKKEIKNKIVNKISYTPDKCVLTIDETDTLWGVIE